MSDLVVVPHDAADDADWDAFVRSSGSGTIFHLRRFLGYHPVERFTDASVRVMSGNATVALLPAVGRTLPDGRRSWVSHPGASYGGPVYRADLSFEGADDLIRALIEYARTQGYDRVQWTLPPIIYGARPSHYLEFALLEHGFGYARRDLTSAVDLADKEHPEILQSSLRSSTKTNVNRARRMGVTIRTDETDAGFTAFYALLERNLWMRHEVKPTHTLSELLDLKHRFLDEITLHGAWLGEQLIAGIVTFTTNPRVVLAFYISHDHAFQEYRALSLLFVETIRSLAHTRFTHLDFGLINGGPKPSPSLARFKENFGATGLFRDVYALDLS